VLPLLVPGTLEEDLAAALSAALRRHGCDSDSFPPVVSSGAAASTPHGDGTRGVLVAGTLLVLDVGCYKDHYASDFTRTFPVGGAFTPEQRKAVEAVLAAQAAALASCKAGAHFAGTEEPPSLTQVAADELARRGLPANYGHGLGHTVGLFAHDVDDHKPLRAGMIITLEPGRYEKGAFGIRIEDTFLVRDADCTALTEGLPADPASIEALLTSARRAPAP
jgi:Xaa-Pro aminopeptidase